MKMKHIIRYIGVVSFIAALAAAFYLWHHSPQSRPIRDSVTEQQGTGTEAATANEDPVPAGMQRYRNPRFHFRLDYPESLTAKDSIDGGALTVVFEDAEGRGFQIYALPYVEETISDKRFKMDNPSGVMKDPVDITIDGAPAQMFFSTNAAMGETREVWFLRAGVLYEVNTYKELDGWLSEIMRTWKFI